MADSTRFRMVGYSGAIIDSGWWGSMVVDVGGIRTPDRVPALREHIRDRAAGVIDHVVKENGQLIASGFFLDSRDGREVQALLRQQYPMQASIGVWAETVEQLKAGESSRVNGQTFTGPGYIWRKSFVREISFCSLGADSQTSVAIAASLAGAWNMNTENSFEARVANFMAEGHSEVKAVGMAVKQYPEAHKEYLQRLREQAKTSAGRPHKPEAPAKAAWMSEIHALQERGLTLRQAMAELEKNRPELREAMLREANSR